VDLTPAGRSTVVDLQAAIHRNPKYLNKCVKPQAQMSTYHTTYNIDHVIVKVFVF